MTIAFACDHGGFAFREDIFEYLEKKGHVVLDFWPNTLNELDDFPDYVTPACEALIAWKAERGILICGSGVGMAIAANRHPEIRAVLCYSAEVAKLSRQHNDTNVICFGARTMNIVDVIIWLETFLTESFIGGKYEKRNKKMECMC